MQIPRSLILAIDASDRSVSVFLGRGGFGIIAESRSGAVESLASLIKDVVSKSAVSWSDIDLCACSVGPGSYTGIRAAVAASNGLAVASSMPLMGVTRFEQLIASVHFELSAAVDVIAPATRGMVAVQSFSRHYCATSAPQLISPLLFVRQIQSKVWLVDRSVRKLIPTHESASKIDSQVHAIYVARVAEHKLQQGATAILKDRLKPLYLTPPDARPNAGSSLVQAIFEVR